MSPYRVRLSSNAIRQLNRASAWWRRHRDKAPDAFDQDTDAAFELLRSNPLAGTPIRARRPGVRRLWLERIGYFVYYRFSGERTGDDSRAVARLARFQATRVIIPTGWKPA